MPRTGTEVLKRAIYPLTLLYATATAWSFNWLVRGWMAPVASQSLATSLTIGATTLWVLIWEKILPYRRDWLKDHGDSRADLAYTVLFFPVGLRLTLAVFQRFVPLSLQWSALSDASSMPLAVRCLVALLIAEFFFYWIHRYSHESPGLWRFHAVHHSVPRVYWMNAGSLHFIDFLLNFTAYLLPLVFLGASPQVIEFVILATSVTGLLEHANIDHNTPILNRFFNTAELHRWHHSKVISESMTNYGKGLSIWDLIFATWSRPTHASGAPRAVAQVGIDSAHPMPPGYWAQWVWPFRH